MMRKVGTAAVKRQDKGFFSSYLPIGKYVVRDMECPEIDGNDLREYVIHRIKTIYPGNPDTCEISVERSGKKAKVILAKKLNLAEQEMRGHAQGYICLIQGIKHVDGDFLRIVFLDDAVEAAVFRSGEWSILGSYPLSADAVSIAEENAVSRLQIIYEGVQPEIDASKVDAVFFVDISKKGYIDRKNILFAGKKAGNISRAIMIAAAVSLVVSNIGAFVLREKAAVRYRDFLGQINETKKLFAEDAKLTEQISSFSRNGVAGHSLPATLLMLIAGTGKGLTIDSFRFENGKFYLKGKIANAIALAGTLRSIEGVADLILSDVRTGKDGKESFSLSGAYDDR